MKIKDLREKGVEELQKDYETFKKELFNLRFQSVSGKVEKSHRVRQARKAVARVKTLLNVSKRGLNKENKDA